jgi:hypothetical protein
MFLKNEGYFDNKSNIYWQFNNFIKAPEYLTWENVTGHLE